MKVITERIAPNTVRFTTGYGLKVENEYHDVRDPRGVLITSVLVDERFYIENERVDRATFRKRVDEIRTQIHGPRAGA